MNDEDGGSAIKYYKNYVCYVINIEKGILSVFSVVLRKGYDSPLISI